MFTAGLLATFLTLGMAILHHDQYPAATDLGCARTHFEAEVEHAGAVAAIKGSLRCTSDQLWYSLHGRKSRCEGSQGKTK